MPVRVSIIKKELKDGKRNLQLDFYPPIPHPKKPGKTTRRMGIKTFIYEKPKTALQKLHNKESMQFAELVRMKKQNELNKEEVYGEFEKERLEEKRKSEMSFISYYKELIRNKKGSNYDTWLSTLYYLNEFRAGDILFKDLDIQFCKRYKEYLLTTNSRRRKATKLSNETAKTYFSRFLAALREAFEDGYLRTDLSRKVSGIKEKQNLKEFLTSEELDLLVATPCQRHELKIAALFSATTGMAFAELKSLRWDDIREIEGNFSIPHKRLKTDNVNYLPVNSEAIQLINSIRTEDEFVFPELDDYDRYHHFPIWIANAGIKKKLTFHSMRHTFACLLIARGISIYEVSKMMGHQSVKTTERYAKMIEQSKIKASQAAKIDISSLLKNEDEV